MKLLLFSFIAAIVASVCSCTVAPSVPTPQPKVPTKEEVKTEVSNVTTEKKRQLDAMRERLASENPVESSSIPETTSAITPSVKPKPPAGYPFASPVPGKEGFVFNPYTNNRVDVRDIPRGTLVRDPHDADPNHKFRVP